MTINAPIFFSVIGFSSCENNIFIDHKNNNNSNYNFGCINKNKNLILTVSQCPYVIHYVAYDFIKHIKIPFVIITCTNDFFGEKIQSVTEQDNKLVNISKNSLRFVNRIPKIYANFHLKFTHFLNNHTDLRNGNWRGRLHEIIPQDIIYFEQNILPRTKSWEQMSLYSFVLSPLGNGFDCIRTYEALCLGCIVIIKKSDLNHNCLYSDLPVLVVNEYSEINETLLKVTLELFSQKKFNYEKLYMNYWFNLVKEKFT